MPAGPPASSSSLPGPREPPTGNPVAVGQRVVFLLRKRELVLLHCLLALQEPDPLPMTISELARNRGRFAVVDVVGQLTSAKRGSQMLLLSSQFPDRAVERVGHVFETDLEIDQRVVEDARLTATEAAEPLLVQQAVESGLEFFESHSGVKCYRPMVSLGTMRLPALAAPIALLLLAGCSLSERATRCGIAALAGPTMLLEEFTHTGKTMATVTVPMPEVLPVRIAVGAAQRGLVGQTDSTWIVGVDGPFPPLPEKGFGILLVDPVVGRAAIHERIAALGAGVDRIVLDISHLGVIDGRVYMERVDRFVYKGHEGAVPVVGVLVYNEDGLLSEWREYYDRASLLREMGLSSDFAH